MCALDLEPDREDRGMHRRRWTSFAGKFVRIFFVGVLISGLSAEVSEIKWRVGVPQDWTGHHMKFSRTALRQRPEVASREPRAAFQLYREARAAQMRVAPTPPRASLVSAAVNGDWTVALGAGHVQFGQYPAKWTDNPFAPVTLANCTSDYVVFGLNVVGSATQANLIALNHLYSDPIASALCGTSPTFLFSYNVSTSAGGVVQTSPVISLDGKKIAFIESDPTGGASRTILHVLNVPTSQQGGNPSGVGSPVVPGPGAMTTLIISNTTTDTRSSPWVDYISDTLYVGSNNGRVYKVTGVFKGTPTLAGAPWPKLIAANQRLTSPVFDDVTNKLFVGANDARVYSVSADDFSTALTVLQVGTTTALNPGILDAPIVDSTAGTLLAISSNDSTILNSAVVVQANTSSLTEIKRLSLGLGSTGGTAVDLYAGDFDNNYFTDPATGHLLLCGTAPATRIPTLYNVSFNASAQMTSIAQSSAVSSNLAARCGPITEFYNANIGGGTDFFFFGVTRNCSVGTGVANGCVMSQRTAGGVTTMIAAPARTGTSGIIPDNDSTQPNASSIYFSNEGAAALSFKLTQQGLN